MVTRYPNKDGSACVAIGYDFTDLIITNTNTIHQVWDTNSQPNAVFTYSIPWKPVWAQIQWTAEAYASRVGSQRQQLAGL